MPQFDVYSPPSGPLLLDCQTDFLIIDSRVVVPLLPSGEVINLVRRLNPVLRLDGQDLVMMTQLMSAVGNVATGKRVASLADQQDVIKAAIDMLFGGY